jgi:hypoxanthine phosphoribosyltransferase
MKEVFLHQYWFDLYLPPETIQVRAAEMGRQIASDYAGKRPLFLAVLNGAFIFAADLLRACEIDCELAFVKLSSYKGLSSTGNVETLLGLNVPLEGRDIVIVEDIIDSGNTISVLLPDLQAHGPASIAIAALLVKPECLQHPLTIDYLGFEIPDRFVVGYGLDYDGLGRNLPAIYQLRT